MNQCFIPNLCGTIQSLTISLDINVRSMIFLRVELENTGIHSNFGIKQTSDWKKHHEPLLLIYISNHSSKGKGDSGFINSFVPLRFLEKVHYLDSRVFSTAQQD